MISIVVPVFNVERYIGELINSFLLQTYGDFELILIIDGATDGSADICNEFSKKDSRIRVIEKANGGVSSARNLGIKNVKGDFLMFADGDDYLEPNALESMISALHSTNSDACYCRKYFKDDKVVLTGIPESFSGVISSVDAVKLHLKASFVSSSCLSMVRFIKVRNVFFDENIHALEDWEYNFRLLTCIDTVTIINKPLYHYRTVCGSASKSSLNDRKLTCFLIPDTINKYIEEKGLPYIEDAKYFPVHLIYHMLVILATGEYSTNSARVLQKKARENLKYALTSTDVSVKERIYVLMSAISPKLFCNAYTIKYWRRLR